MRVAVVAITIRVCDGRELFIVTHEPSVLDDPGEGPLDDPAAGKELEALHGSVAADDL